MHVFGHWPYWDLPHKSCKELVKSMDKCGIDQAVVMSLRGMLLDWRAGNDETLRETQRFPDRLIPTATISPFTGGNAAEVQKLADQSFRILRLYPSFHSYQLDSNFTDEICQAASRYHITVMMPTRPMMNWRFQPVPLAAIQQIVQRHPETSFIVSGPNYLAEHQTLARLMKQCNNVAYEISCMQGFGAISALAKTVGFDRLLFGTGALLNYPACNVAKLAHADLPADQKSAVASDNAVRWLRLDR